MKSNKIFKANNGSPLVQIENDTHSLSRQRPLVASMTICRYPVALYLLVLLLETGDWCYTTSPSRAFSLGHLETYSCVIDRYAQQLEHPRPPYWPDLLIIFELTLLAS